MSQYTGLSFQSRSFQFQDIKLKEACWIDGAPYFTGKTIGEWLNYKFPEKSVGKIIKNNPNIRYFRELIILTDRWGKNNKEKKCEIYNPIGLQLIAANSHQPGVGVFQISASRLVTAYINKELTPENTITEESKDPRQIAMNRFKQIDKLPHGEKGSAMEQLAEELGIAIGTLDGWKTQYKNTGIIEDKRKTHSARKKIEKVHIPRWEKILHLLDKKTPRSKIKKRLGVSDSQISRVKTKYKPRWIDKNKP